MGRVKGKKSSPRCLKDERINLSVNVEEKKNLSINKIAMIK